MKKRRLSILLSIVMLFSLLPTTALAAAYDSVKVNDILLNNGSYLESNRSTSAETGANTEPTTYVAWYKSGVLTLNNFTGKTNSGIEVQGASVGDLTIKLIGDNTIKPYTTGIQGNQGSGSITIDSSSGGTLTIDVTNPTESVYGIDGYECSVTITGSANVVIDTETKDANDNSYGIKSEAAVSILGSASVNIIGKTPNSTRTNACYGIYNNDNVTIDTDGTIQIDVSKAGTAATAASWGVNSNRQLTLTKVGGMTVKWKNKDEGGPLYPKREFNSAEYDNNVDKDACIATYMPKVATANISLDKTGTVDFGSMEAGYSAAPTAQTVTITNSGTAATGPLTIALEGTNATSFTLSTNNIANVAANGTETFTVKPNTELSAGTYNATVKVSGTGAGVTEQRFGVQFTVTSALTTIGVPTANSVTYDGTEKTGVSDGTGYTLGGTYKATDVGTTDYTATATLASGYKWNDGSTGDKPINWNIGRRTPTAADFTFAPPTDLTYDGNNKTASVALNSPFTKSGAITLTYMKDSSVVTETKNIGEYTVKIDVAGGENFNAASGLTASAWKFSIAPAEQSAPTSLGVAAPIANGGNGKITGTTDKMEYSTDRDFTSPAGTTCTETATEVAPGTYYVRFKAKTNYNAGAVSAALVVPAYSATKYTVTVTHDTNGMAIADKSANVAAGETVTLTATPNSGYVFDQWTEKTPDSLVIDTNGTFIMPASNVSVKATFTPAALTGTASITGNLKYDQELTASLAGDNNTGTLTYKWYRSGEATEIANNTTGKYTLTEADIGKTITVKITSDAQTGEITGSTTGKIEKADGPAAPDAFTLNFTLNSDGKTFTATIPTVADGEYSFDGTNYSAANTKKDCVANTSYTGYARVKETATHKASTATNSTQTSPKLTVATPTFTPNGVSSFSGTQRVTITCDTVDAKIYYTTDGTDPKKASGTEYTTALTLTSTTTLKAIAVKADMNDSAIATATFTKASGGGGGSSGGSYVPKTQKPEIKAAAGGKTVLSKDGTTLTITADAGKVIDKVLLNGKDMGAVSELKGLKTGDKVEVIFKDQVTEPTKEELDKAAKEAAGDLVLTARSAKLKNGSVKVMLKGDLKAITDAGYTVKYKFYRSTKKSAGYKAVLTKKAPTYFNTYGKKGTMYYYKARVMIYDKNGNFVAQTALKQCKYANRLWTK